LLNLPQRLHPPRHSQLQILLTPQTRIFNVEVFIHRTHGCCGERYQAVADEDEGVFKWEWVGDEAGGDGCGWGLAGASEKVQVFENALALTGFAEFLGLRLRVLHLLSGGNNIGGKLG
jgi:hypothetical protein